MVASTLPPGHRDPGHRIERDCAECRKVDDHPRHSHWTVREGQHVIEDRHVDCCAAAGCPDGSCDRVLAEHGPARGLALVAALTRGV